MKIICNNGEGREKNIHAEKIGTYPIQYTNPLWRQWDETRPLLPVYDQRGNLFTSEGEFEGKIKKEYYSGGGLKRRYYIISDDDPTDQEKEETKTSKKINSSAITRRFERTFLPHGGNPPDIEKLEPGEEESVEEKTPLNLLFEYASEHTKNIKGKISREKAFLSCAMAFENGYKSGQKSQPNLIEKEKVIELLEAEMERVVGIIKKYAKYRMMDLTPLIREIKNLTN